MEKKHLIGGSILAVVLLVMGSLYNVTGYQSVKSTVNDSPLFSIRTQEASKKYFSGIPKSVYLGKGRNTIQIPMPENKTILYQKIFDKIKCMDDTTFSHFIRRILQIKNLNEQFQTIDETTILTGLHLFRKQDVDFKQYLDCLDTHSSLLKIRGNFTSFPCWFPGRFILLFIEFILAWSTLFLLRIYCTIVFPDCTPPTSMTSCCH